MSTENKAITEKALKIVREFVEVKQSYAWEETLHHAILHLFQNDEHRLDTDIPSYYEETTKELIQFFLNPEILNAFLSTSGKRSTEWLSKYLFELQFFFTQLQEPITRAGLYEIELTESSPSEESILHTIDWYSYQLEEQKALKEIHNKYHDK